ncbi:hypothetical protein BCR43DRAFT_148926 [Syncephalastrum racemosum]|uniref:Uncharacterized protein n=1 Tax=Syncephalastrum racemosum TaxID=13706 RepID=A0A1X2HMT8_SYNRA|nr:hypothetical protein BCR43DRAFT_148926 [Syncephalastrum racemosum]
MVVCLCKIYAHEGCMRRACRRKRACVCARRCVCEKTKGRTCMRVCVFVYCVCNYASFCCVSVNNSGARFRSFHMKTLPQKKRNGCQHF